MEFNKYENLLQMHTSCIKEVLGDDFDNKLFESHFFYIKNEEKTKSLYGMKYNSVTVLSDKKEIINSISIHFVSTIDKNFYNQLIQHYGTPDEIKIVEKKIFESKSYLDDEHLNQEIRRNTIILKDGTFEEKPIYIIWKKEKYDITIFTRHEQNISELIIKSNK